MASSSRHSKVFLRLEDTEEILRGAPPESAEGVSQRIEVFVTKNPALMKAFLRVSFFRRWKRYDFQRFGCPQSEQSVQEYIERSEKWNGHRFFLQKMMSLLDAVKRIPHKTKEKWKFFILFIPIIKNKDTDENSYFCHGISQRTWNIFSLPQPTHTDSEAFLVMLSIPENTVPPIGTGSYGEKNRELVASL